MSSQIEPLRSTATDVAGSSTNVAGAIYGQIIASSEVAALSLDKELDSAEILAALVVTMLLFWVAHVYAGLISDRLAPGRVPAGRELRLAMARDWPMVQAAAPAGFALGLGAIGVLSTGTAVTLALGLGVANLFAWGLAIGRRSGLPRTRALAVASVSALFGLTIEALKVLVH